MMLSLLFRATTRMFEAIKKPEVQSPGFSLSLTLYYSRMNLSIANTLFAEICIK